MTLTAIAATLVLAQAAPPATAPPTEQVAPIQLGRVFQKGQRLAYEVRSNLQIEQRQFGLHTFIPSELDINYDFTLEVQEMKADGIAQVLYLRPTMTQIDGETYAAPPKTTVHRTNIRLQLDVSPINEILNIRDLNPPSPAPARPDASRALMASGLQGAPEIPVISRYIQELYRLALFIGALDSGMDFSPKLPYEEVRPGATWRRTVGYQPQRLPGATGETVVKRLDYTFTYDGIVESGGRRVHRVTATLGLDTDAAPMLNQMVPGGAATTGLSRAELKLSARIRFDLDLESMHTILAQAESEGSTRIFATQLGNEPALEDRFRGRTTLRLASLR
jgi:hypothetical protein